MYLCSSVLDSECVLHYSYSIRELPLLVVDEMGTVDLCAVGRGLDIWSNRCARVDLWYTGKCEQDVCSTSWSCKYLFWRDGIESALLFAFLSLCSASLSN